MNANELTALIGECLRETDDHEFFLKLESVLRQQQAEIEELKIIRGNSVLVPSDKLAEMQAELITLRKALNEMA